MSVRIQISDRKNNLVTVQVTMNVTSVAGNWMPDYPGKIRSSTDWDKNTWEGTGSTQNRFADAVCYTLDGTGVRVLVMRLNGLCTRTFGAFLKAGSGYLYASGVLTMTEGICTWSNLDASTSDSSDMSNGNDDSGDSDDD
jgi:hypothetical protein